MNRQAWTTEQERFLREHAYKGAAWCARSMRGAFGVSRTANAVAKHAYRMGLSLRRCEVCPECGRFVTRLNRVSGMCRECSARLLAEETERRYWRAEANERRMAESAKAYERESAMYRKRIERLNKKRKGGDDEEG